MNSNALKSRIFLTFSLLLLCVSLPLQAQIRPMNRGYGNGSIPADPDGSEFHFTRLQYSGNDIGRGFGGRGSWTTDWPEAEHFMMEGLSRLTKLDVTQVSVYNGEGGELVNLSEDTIFDFPWLYAVEVGRWALSLDEASKLREYLLRGGFLMVDDFHGSYEWQGFVNSMKRVFPDRPIIDIPADDEVFHVLYDLDQKQQIPGLGALYRGVTFEQDGIEPHWRGIYDDQGRLIVAINHNMDLGDAWEHADTPGYPEPMTALAYRFAVNYVIYSMTH